MPTLVKAKWSDKLEAIEMPPAKQALRERLKLYWQRHQQRKELARLSDYILKDLGITRVDALQEADKPFWKP